MPVTDPNFWLTIRPWALSLQAAGFFALAFVVFFVVGVVLITLAGRLTRRDPHCARGERQLGTWFVAWGLLGLGWTFFAYEGINVFGAPFWLPVGAIGAIVWLGFIAAYYLRTLPALRTTERVRQEREQYLPKRKN